jgi:hypothetical protein
MFISMEVKEKGRCMQCGKPSTGSWIRTDEQDRVFHTEWCDTHFPTVWTILAKADKRAEKAARRAEARKWSRFA